MEGDRPKAVTSSFALTTRQQKRQFPVDVYLRDQSIRLSPFVERYWLFRAEDYSDKSSESLENQPPPAKILLTSFGWNHKDQVFALNNFGRSTRQRELLQAVVDHPWFDMSWDEYQSGKKTINHNLRYYVFLDVETCFEKNYPVYSREGDPIKFRFNADTAFDRKRLTADDQVRTKEPCFHISKCPFLPRVLASSLFRTMREAATLIYLDCNDEPTRPEQDLYYRSRVNNSTSLSYVALTATNDQVNTDLDQGLPPPAIVPVQLSRQQEHDIETCNETGRPYLLTFIGQDRAGSPRNELAKLHNGKDIRIKVKSIRIDFRDTESLHTGQNLYTESKFSCAPRGDAHYSFRFTEILSAGSIPVVHADGWVLPFRKELIDWNECAVVIPEREINQTERILRSISDEQRCRMRKRCYEIYKTYMASPDGTIAGIIQGLELRAMKKRISIG